MTNYLLPITHYPLPKLMLVPLTRKTFEMLIPPVATGAQYAYYWGKSQDFLKRLLISVVTIVVVWLMSPIFGEGSGTQVQLVFGIIGGLYWLWGPVALASFRNLECRKYQYCGFWQGRVLDVYITDDLIGQEETVNARGELVIVENRERRLNLEVGDKTGFSTVLKVPLRKEHQKIAPGQAALMLVMSNQPNLSRIAKSSDIYIPSQNVWVSDYPYLRRDEFIDISRELKEAKKRESKPAAKRSDRDRSMR